MAKKKQVLHPKRISVRTCVACRQPASKRTLVRLVRTQDGIEIDLTGKKSGRGAYLCKSLECWEKAVSNNQIAPALRIKVTDVDLQKISEFMDTLTMKNHV